MSNTNYKYYYTGSRYLKNLEIQNSDTGAALPLLFEKPVFEPEDIALYYTVPQNYEGRIDLISNDVYGDVRLYWAICIANNIDNLIDNTGFPKAGEMLAIPTFDSVRKFV